MGCSEKNPGFAELIELLGDQEDLENAKSAPGKDITLTQYLKNRDIRDCS
jgi:hypothetical protein